ncbi:MAG TPA: glycogen debranching N-terminal domain-containing protein [Caulobacteraceae bacterium]
MANKPLSIDIRHPLVMKANELALLTREDGDIPGDVIGFGLFYRDTCYLARYRLRLAAEPPLLLGSSDEAGTAALISLTNPELKNLSGRDIPAHKLQIERSLTLPGDGLSLADLIEIESFCEDKVHLELTLDLQSAFRNVLALRGADHEVRGELYDPAWDGRRLRLSYAGADQTLRSLVVEFSPAPAMTIEDGSARAVFGLDLVSRNPIAVAAISRIDERPARSGPSDPLPRRSVPAMPAAAEAASAERLTDFASFHCYDGDLNRVMRRSLSDLRLLGVRRGKHAFTGAGLPWYLGLFGRDSLLPSLQALAFDPDLSAGNVRALAELQGAVHDERTGEEPGRILHELRVGELASLHRVPQTPSYSSVDSTLLFLIALARHVRWMGDPTLFRDLRPQVDRALAWIDRREHASALGFIDYDGKAKSGAPLNQAWRDSGQGVLRADGAYPDPPLALIEVQGYAFMARREIAAVLRRLSEDRRADQLESQAADLAARFDRAFWMDAEGCYCLALEHGGRQVRSITSNAAQVLWTGIARPDRAEPIARRMLRSDMFSGWGVRTLSTSHPRYDPFAYQQGSVWPFDNALIVSGLRRYGADAAAVSVFQAVLAAAIAFRDGRLPEFLAGVERREGASPTRSPRADPLQAWSASAIPFMVTELLGLEVDGFERRLSLRRPVLPESVSSLEINGLRAGGGVGCLRLQRSCSGSIEPSLKTVSGELLLTVLE